MENERLASAPRNKGVRSALPATSTSPFAMIDFNGFYEKMRPAEFWAMHAAIAADKNLLVVLFGRRLSRALHPVQ